MSKQTEINYAQIRAESVPIEELAYRIGNSAKELRERFNALYDNLKFSPSLKDSPFDRYMCSIAGMMMLGDQAPSLAYQAREMQLFGKKQLVEDVAHLNRLTPATSPVAVPA
ncbi:MAG: hypothetical protein NT011_13615 [Kiritimatiellaeota bacterium]|nr:hypothetical protein [Kiritimatiellota bacterium]